MKVIGIDLGTTGICGVVIDGERGEVISSVTKNSDAFITGTLEFEKIQDVDKIIGLAKGILDGFIDTEGEIAAIGITGQMHGIVYVDSEGRAVSPLYTWQDGRGDLPYRDGKSYAEHLGSYAGYGNVTHFYNKVEGLVPKSAVSYCTIHDYLAMHLCGRVIPIMHVSDAASFGLYDMAQGKFFPEVDYVGEITDGFDSVGSYRGIPVSVAIGDNQASVFATLASEGDLLINVGTGSQVSVILDEPISTAGVECRPYVGGKYLAVGAALCGGRAYSLLASFFERVLSATGVEGVDIYSLMGRFLDESAETELSVDTRFAGTRGEPHLRGAITNISTSSFTPADMTRGFVLGIIEELYGMYSSMGKTICGVVGSGNGIRKNPAMADAARAKFGFEVKIPLYCEEAACGAAFFAMVATGLVKSASDIGKLIRYKEN